MRAALALTLLLGCGGDPHDGNDSGVDSDINRDGCWPDVATQVPHGSLTLGMGRGGFHPMPDEVPMEWGIQDGFMFVLSAQMTGFPPGNPANILDPSNPYTRIRAFIDDTNVPLNRYVNCAFRNSYKETPAGDYELREEVAVMFETCWRIDRLVGQRIRLEGEILDPNGNYAFETRVVTAAVPVDPSYPKDQDSDFCQP